MDWIVVDTTALTRSWWTFVLRGIVGVAFGILTLFEPGISLAALILLFGVYSFVDGIFALLSAITRRHRTSKWWSAAVQGLLGIAAGVVTLVYPSITALALLYLIAAWAFLTGVFEITAAIHLRREIRHEWLIALSGVLSLALGVALALAPARGALAVVLWIGAYALVSGIALIALGIRLRLHKPGTGSHLGHLPATS